MIARLALAAVAAMGLATAAPAFDLSEMTEDERATFRAEIRAYLLENPEVLMEAIAVLDQREREAQVANDQALVASYADDLFDDGHSWVGGNPDGDITIVEFLDYRCGYCRRAHDEVAKLLEADGNIRWVVKEFPILGPDSVKAGKMALAAVQVDAEKFKTLSDGLMDYRGNLTEQVAYQIAAESGYDIAELKEVAASGEIDDRLNRNYQLARKLGLEGTPAFVVGTEIIRGYLPLEDMLAAVQEARREMN